MQEIRLSLRKSAIANVVLGMIFLCAGVWLYSHLEGQISTALLLCSCVSIFGAAFIYLGVRTYNSSLQMIRYGDGILEIPISASSQNTIRFSIDEITHIGVRSYILPYIKVLEVNSKTKAASISLEAFADKSDVDRLLTYCSAALSH